MGRLAVAWLALTALLASCEEPPPPDPVSTPTSLRGAVVIEPPTLTVGDVAKVEVTLVTPPGHAMRPVRPPTEVAGFWVLDARALPTERSEARWVHRTRIRARAREPGSFEWPSLRVEVETPEREVVEVELEARPLEVASVADRFPARDGPFPLRRPELATDGAFLAPLAGGAGLAIAAFLLIAALRRLRGGQARATRQPVPEIRATPGWRAAQATLETALERIDARPAEAADAASAALRHFFSHRFAVSARTLTTQELTALDVPLGAEKHWPSLLEILEALDAARFRSVAPAADLREVLERARGLVASAAPEARWR